MRPGKLSEWHHHAASGCWQRGRVGSPRRDLGDDALGGGSLATQSCRASQRDSFYDVRIVSHMDGAQPLWQFSLPSILVGATTGPVVVLRAMLASSRSGW